MRIEFLEGDPSMLRSLLPPSRRLRLPRRSRSAVAGCAALLLASPALADTIVLPVDEDSAPYSFVPGLPRGIHYDTLYAVQGFDVETSTEHDFETYLWFDVTPADLPAGHVLTRAELRVVYAFDQSVFGGEPSTEVGTLECREVTGPWNEADLIWTNRPSVTAPFATITGIDTFGALRCDATAVVLRWIYDTSPNEGFALTNPTEREIGMHSREASVAASLKPMLILTTELPEPGTAAALAAGAGALAAMARRRRGASA